MRKQNRNHLLKIEFSVKSAQKVNASQFTPLIMRIPSIMSRS